MSISKQSGLQAPVPSAPWVFGRWSRPPATGRGSGGAGTRYDTDFNSVGGCDSGPHNANYSVDAGDHNANVMARTTAQANALVLSSDNGVTWKRINDDQRAALLQPASKQPWRCRGGQGAHRRAASLSARNQIIVDAASSSGAETNFPLPAA